MSFAVVAVLAIKVAMLTTIGAAEYDRRIARLAVGTIPERMGAFVLQADPLTSAIGSLVAPGP